MHAFLSYSRDDDDGLGPGSFVRRLAADLTAAGVEVWWDRTRMPNRGPTFDREIRDAISRSDRLLLVLGPGAVASRYVRQEWEWAVEICKPVVPLLRSGDYSILPRELARLDALDFRSENEYSERLRYLLRQLAEPVAPLGKLVNVPGLPPHHVARQEDLEGIRDLLLPDPLRSTAAGHRVGIHGMGGLGKSVLAAAFARRCDVRWSFPDGVLWVTLGKEPNPGLLLSSLCQALGDLPVGRDEEGARARLSELLAPRACLIVLDDVWASRHVQAFDVLGPRCALLLTGRDSTISAAFGIPEVRLGALSGARAVELLRGWTGRDDPSLPAVADRLGRLPLALKIAGARLQRGMTGAAWLETFHRISQIRIGPRAMGRDENLEVCFDLSLEELPAREQRLYAALSVFAASAPIPERAADRLWQRIDPSLDDFFCAELRHDLAQLALVDRSDDGTLRLHDLLHAFCRERMPGEAEALHRALLDAYNPDEKPWPALADDGYLFEHLVAHLVEAGRSSNVHKLLCEETADGRNAWFEARDRLGQAAGFREDVARAWRLARESPPSPERLAFQVRYALIAASVQSRSTNIPPELMASSTARGVWTPPQALAYAEQGANPKERLKALRELEPQLAGRWREEALRRMFDAAREIPSAENRLETLADLAGRCEGALREEVVQTALSTVGQLGRSQKAAPSFRALAPCLPSPWIAAAREAADTLRDPEDRALAKAALLPFLPELQQRTVLSELLAGVPELPNPAAKTRVLSVLAPHLRGDLLFRAFELGRALAVPVRRAEALTALATSLPADERLRVLSEALEMAGSIPSKGARAQAIRDVAVRLAEAGHPDRALEAVRKIDFPAGTAQALNALISRLPEEQSLAAQAALLDTVPRINRPEAQAEALAELAPHLSTSLVAQALAVARRIDSDWRRADALCELAARVPEAERAGLLEEALGAARPQGSTVLTEISHRLARLGLSQQACEAARLIGDERTRAEILRRLVPRLPAADQPRGWDEALAVAQAIQSPSRRAEALMWLALEPPIARREQVFKEAELATYEIRGQNERHQAWNRVWDASFRSRTQEPPAGLGEGALRERLAEAQRIGDRRDFWHLALSLAPAVEESLVLELLAAAGDETGWLPAERGEVLAALAPRLPESLLRPAVAGILRSRQLAHFALLDLAELTPFLAAPVLRWAVDAALDVRIGLEGVDLSLLLAHPGKEAKEERQQLCLRALRRLAPRIIETASSGEALKAVRKFLEPHRLEALLAVAPHLTEPFRQRGIEEALALSRAMGVEAELRALLSLAPHLPEALHGEILARVLGLSRAEQRFVGLLSLAPVLSGELQATVLEKARRLKKYKERYLLLSPLAERLPAETREEIFHDELAANPSGAQRASFLRTFARHLSADLQREALAMNESRLDAKDLLLLAGQLAGAARREALHSALRRLEGESVEAALEVQERIGPFLDEVARDDLAALWENTLERLIGFGRRSLLQGLSRLTPSTIALGGEPLATEALRMAQKVEHWWP